MIERTIQMDYRHRVVFTHGLFAANNPLLADELTDGADDCSRMLVFIDEGLLRENEDLLEAVEAYAEAQGGRLKLVARPVILPGGEACKNEWRLVESVWDEINRYGLCRHSYVVAIGGGAFLDMVGFGAATAHRGVRLVRVPTTTLSQGDGGVGVKNGVNHFGKKNWVGTFSVPHVVINDFDFLESLSERDRRDGIIEAIKVALIRDAEFYQRLENNSAALAALEPAALEMAIRRSAELHVEHIATGGDPFEYGSARPLDFGHWVAHKLEQLSAFAVSHGEAVAIGMAVDLLYSVRAGILDESTAGRILDLIEEVGFDLWSTYLEPASDGGRGVLNGIEEFREHLGGQLTITLVPVIGEKLEVHTMDERMVELALADLKQRVLSRSSSMTDGQKNSPATTELV
ncbi:MAG: 3-dehydroquinate synthase [Verrucomicrobiota bacterium]